MDTRAPSGEIDRQVKRRVQAALSLYQIDAAALRALRPDVILTQAQCEVCAVSLDEVKEAVADWVEAPPEILSLNPRTLADVWSDVRRIAEALGAAGRGESLARQLAGRVEEISAQAGGVRERPTVACLEWLDPLMAAGNWVPELVELAGGVNLFGEGGQHSPWLDWEAVRERDPQVIVVMPCGFDLARTRQEMTALTGRPGWAKLRAVCGGRVCVTDGNQFFNRPGPRLVESLEILAEILHPERFRFGHEGRAWRGGRINGPCPQGERRVS
jgi:iron complex transport system substrate-binding protein